MECEKKLITALLSVSLLIPAAVAVAAVATNTFSTKMMLVVFMMFIMLPLAAMGAYMWATGKGQWAISGYNTMPESKREYYNAEKMSKDVGKLTTVISLVTLAGLCMTLYIPHSFIVLFIIIAFVLGISIFFAFSKGDKYLKDPAKTPPAATKKERKTQKILAGISVAVVAAILIAVFLFIGSGSVNASMDDERLHVDAPMVNSYVYYEDVRSVDLRENIDLGMRVGGFGGSKILSGNFNNGEFGDYTLACNKDVKTYIVVEHGQGKILVFNLGSAGETVGFFEDLTEKTHL
ncbi:MAG: DUF3784 domain-containing protein [Candidatus Methanoplasma sp.]|nr:DUF3784 domain-containing protein [Candidatus Methanoplasma sp.]